MGSRDLNFRFLKFVLLGCVVSLLACPTLRAATIVLDPGHGGQDPGGIPRQRYSEKQAALDVALRVRARLLAAGHRVIMTRTSDVFVELADRVAISNHAPSKAVFVSLHFNSSPTRDAHGIETYHCGRSGAFLAHSIHQKVVAATGEQDRGVRQARFYVLRFNRRASALVELGFLTNSSEGSRIARSSAYRQKLATGVASGILSVVR